MDASTKVQFIGKLNHVVIIINRFFLNLLKTHFCEHFCFLDPDSLMNYENHTPIRWEARSIELQDIDVPAKHVLTGVSFDSVAKDGVHRFRLVASSVPIDFVSGKINFIENGFHYSYEEPSR